MFFFKLLSTRNVAVVFEWNNFRKLICRHNMTLRVETVWFDNWTILWNNHISLVIYYCKSKDYASKLTLSQFCICRKFRQYFASIGYENHMWLGGICSICAQCKLLTDWLSNAVNTPRSSRSNRFCDHRCDHNNVLQMLVNCGMLTNFKL